MISTSIFIKISIVFFTINLSPISSVIAQYQPTATNIEERALEITEMQNDHLVFYGNQEELMFEINLRYLKKASLVASNGRSIKTIRILRKINNSKEQEMKTVLDKKQFNILQKKKDVMRKKLIKSIQESGEFNLNQSID